MHRADVPKTINLRETSTITRIETSYGETQNDMEEDLRETSTITRIETIVNV